MTAPTITYRSDTGRDLQASEIDGNFRNLANAIVDLQTNPTLPDSIASITVSGSSMTITLTSGAVLGPFVLPTLMFRWRGTYDAGANYATMDVFTVAQQGIYVALKPFTSATVFDGPTLLSAGFIQQLFGAVDASLSGLSDVQITALAGGQVIEWNATDQKWENVTLGSMAAQNANAVAITGGEISNTEITGLPAPVNPTDAVTKAYADALALGVPSIPDGDIMANTTGGAASPVGTPLSTILDHALATTARGTVIFRGAAGWIALPPGSSGQVLKSGGAGADVTWGAGASGVTDIAAGTGISTGGADITTTGTISLAAIANGSLVANTSGATAAPVATTLSAMLDAALSATRGAVIYRGNAGWAALLPGTSGKYLKTAGVGADPLWDSPAGAGTVTDLAAGTGISTGGSDITSTGTISLAAIADSTLLGNISGASAAPTPSTMTLILDHVFGSAQGDIIVRGASTWGALAPGTNGQVLTTGGAGANAAWANAPTGSAIADKFLLANTSGGSATASGHSLSDILDYIIASSRGTIAYRGASGWTGLGPGTAGQVLQTGGTTGDPSWTSAGAAGSLAGDSDVSLASPADKDLLAYVSSASKWENKSLASVMDAIGSTQGDILYRSTSGWVPLAPGSSGQVLQSGGAGANPSWTSVGAPGTLSGTFLSVIGANGNSASIAEAGSGGVFNINETLISYGSGAQQTSVIELTRARGTAAAPTAIQSGDILGVLDWGGYGATGFFTGANIQAVATENWTDAHNGTKLLFGVIANGTIGISSTPYMELDQDGGLILSGATGGSKGLGTLNTAGGMFVNGAATITTATATLAGETDVSITSPADKDVLVYDSASSKWKNQRAKYNIGFASTSGVLTASQLLGFHKFSKAVTIPANFGSYLGHTSEAGGTANATASTVINVDKATAGSPTTFSNVGTITIASGSVTPTFASSGGGAISFAQGDVLRVQGPGTADASFANFFATLIGFEA